MGENVTGLETIQYGWSLGTDEYSNEELTLTLPDGTLYETFYPCDE